MVSENPRRPRRFLFIMDPISAIHQDQDTTFVLMLETRHRGHHAYYCEIPGLFANGAVPHARVRRAEVARANPHYKLFEERTEPLSWFDAIFMRKDPPFDRAYLHATHLLSLVDPEHTLLINDPRGLRDANEKLYALQFPEIIPTTLVSSDMAQLRSFLEALGGEMIIKPLDGAGGRGIFHLRTDDRNVNALLEASTNEGRRLIIAQQYLPEARAGDKRIILLDGEPLGAVLRVPRADDTRGNIHVGGAVEQCPITEIDQRIIATVAPSLRRDGLRFVGLDVIGDFLTEINVTSPTGIQEINTLNSVRLESDVVTWVERHTQDRVKGDS